MLVYLFPFQLLFDEQSQKDGALGETSTESRIHSQSYPECPSNLTPVATSKSTNLMVPKLSQLLSAV